MSAYKRKKGNSLTEGVSLFGYYQQQTARIGAITSVRAVRHFHIDALSVSILAGIKASIHYMLRARCRKVTICARVQMPSGMKELSPVPAVIRPVNRFLIVAALRHIHECVGRGSTGGGLKEGDEIDVKLIGVWTRRSSGGGGGSSSVTKYAVTISSADNGKVTSDKTRAAKDSVVTITTKANDGYVLDTIKATDKAGKEIKLTDKGDGKYTFTMPASKVEVKAAFKQTASKPGKPAEEMKTVVVMQIGSKTMFVNGKAYEKDAAPVIMNDRTLVPIRFVTESLGGKVAWNAETKEVTLVIDGKEIKMTIGKTIEKYGVAPVIINGRTFVPVRFVADELGATTAWNAETKTVTITKAVTPVKTEK